MLLQRWLILSTLLSISVSATGQSLRAEVSSLTSTPFDLNPYVQYIEDPNKTITQEMVIPSAANQQSSKSFKSTLLPPERWERNTSKNFIGTNVKSRYWFKVTFNLDEKEAQEAPILYFNTHASILINLDIWIPQNDDLKKYSVGAMRKFINRDIIAPHYAFALPKKSGSYTIYGSMDNTESSVPAVLPFYIYSKRNFENSMNKTQIFFAAFYSVMFALLLYNLFLTLILRESLYGYYCLFIVVAVLLCSSIDGSAIYWLWPQATEFSYRLLNSAGIIGSLVYLFFVYEALERLSISPKLQLLFKVSYLIGGGSLIHNITTLSFNHAAMISQGYATLVFNVTLISIIYCIFKRIHGAGFLFIAELCTAIGGAVFMLYCQGKTEGGFFSFWSLHLGYLSEVILLSLALAVRTKYAMEDKVIAESSNRAKSQFFASMSHEFRTPLTSILGYANNALRTSANDQERIEALSVIKHSGQHLLQLINDILDISKIEAQKLEVENIDIDIFELVKEVNEHCGILCESKNLYIEVDYLFPLPSVIKSDPTRIKQILINLCSNAIKFTAKGGITIHISCDKDTNSICFAVSDTGIGMSEEQQLKLFSAYAQAEAATARQFGGTGLGLYLSKQFAEKLGGDITVNSEQNKGSTFTLTISSGDLDNRQWVNQQESATAFSAGAKTQITNIREASSNVDALPTDRKRERKLTAVLAEDNIVNQKLISKILQNNGLNVLSASDGLEAISLVLSNKTDVVFMDMNMPLMDGLTATKYLREKGFEKPIYALTADETTESIALSKEAGCTAHLSKPINDSILSGVVSNLKNTDDISKQSKS